MKIKKTERGWAGHFICASDCTFRRNTLVEYGKKKVVVSTVGCMRRINDSGNYSKPEEIGWNRYYETMSFMADDSIYNDANLSEQIYPSVDVKWAIDKQELEEKKDYIDNVADEMHENYVKAIESMLINGEIK